MSRQLQTTCGCTVGQTPTCCAAMTASCLSCQDCCTATVYCEAVPAASGCPTTDISSPEPLPVPEASLAAVWVLMAGSILLLVTPTCPPCTAVATDAASRSKKMC